MDATGYFTIERNLVGKRTDELERALGFRFGRFSGGVSILRLLHQPRVDQFELGGSTRYSDRRGLVTAELSPNRIPSAWLHQRLVKVKPILDAGFCDSRAEPEYPDAPGEFAVEQWWLKKGVRIPAEEVCTLQPGESYWGASHRQRS